MIAPEVTSDITGVHAKQAAALKKQKLAAAKALKRAKLLEEYEKHDQPRRREMSRAAMLALQNSL